MPSLEQLDEFKSSFKDVGNEAITLMNQGLTPEDYDLPDSEPPAPFPDGLGTLDGPNLTPGSPASDFSLDSLLDTPADDFSDNLGSFEDFTSSLAGEPSFPDVPLPESGGEVPPDLLSGFADDLESDGFPDEMPKEGFMGAPTETGLSEFDTGELEPFESLESEAAVPAAAEPSTPPAFPPEENDDLDLANLPGIDLSEALDMGGEESLSAESEESSGEESFSEESAGEESSGEEPAAADLGDLSGLGDFSMDGLEDLGAGEESTGDTGADIDVSGFDMGDLPLNTTDTTVDDIPDIPEADVPETAGFGDLDIPDFGMEEPAAAPADISGEETEPAEDADDFGSEEIPILESLEDAGDSGFPAPDLSADGDEAVPDAFDSFNLGSEAPNFDSPAEEEFPEDFALDSFDDPFAAKSGSAPRAARTGPAPSDEVEEIRLDENEYRRLQDTLSAYPLNLRVAIEEIIAEQAVAPDLMSALIKLLTRGAPAKETASLAGKILSRTIPIPRGFTKLTGEELEAEQASLGYLFTHSILPVLRVVGLAAMAALCLGYLGWRFIINPMIANNDYKKGYECIGIGEYNRANEWFNTAFVRHRIKNWFYRYAEAFRDVRQYTKAEEKYDQLLRFYPQDKKGALDYANMEANYENNFEKADRIIRTNILDYSVNDREGLLALAEINLAWGGENPDRYEEARAAYARLMEKYGRKDPYLEGMLKYFIRTDQLNEVLPLQAYFMGSAKKRKITVPTLAELGGYLLDKRFSDDRKNGRVPDEYSGRIEGIRDILLRAIKEDNAYPESYYHLARYYNKYGSAAEERQTLQQAVRVFDTATRETSTRAAYRVDAHRRYAEVLIDAREFFPAEEELVRGIRIYEDARARDVLKTNAEFGRLYADLGDLTFFTKDGDMETALRYYGEAERNGWAPVDMQYRMGAAHYELEQWEKALERFFIISGEMPDNRRLLYALGNVSYLRGNYYAAQNYYNRLMTLLDTERVRFPSLVPGSRPEEQELAERIMVADNNLAVTLETLTRISGNTSYRSRALGLLSESIRAWDVLTRNPQNMSRMRPIGDLYGPGVNLAYINAQNILHPLPNYNQQIFMRIDRDVLDPSPWEALVPREYRLSENLTAH